MFHKVKEVEALDNMMLKIKFADGIVKLYNVKEIINKWQCFELLKDKELFCRVKVDQGGYGVSWNDDIDIGCNELWENGIKKD